MTQRLSVKNKEQTKPLKFQKVDQNRTLSYRTRKSDPASLQVRFRESKKLNDRKSTIR